MIDIRSFTLKNDFLEITVLNLGGIIHEIKMPDKEGTIENILYGFKSKEDYKENLAYFGAVVGRTAGRITKGRFQISGKSYDVPCQDNGNSLHGGIQGFSHKLWDVEERNNQLSLTYISPDGEEGYPGEVRVNVLYTLEGDTLSVEYFGTTTQDTLLNLTHHCYFNLTPSASALEMETCIESSSILKIDDASLPTGEIMSVEDSPFDFRVSKKLSHGIKEAHEQLIKGNGYNHPWLLEGDVHISADNGRRIIMKSTQPVVVVYGYNYPLEGDKAYRGVAFEFQQAPDGINHEGFDTSILKASECYYHRTSYKFIVD